MTIDSPDRAGADELIERRLDLVEQYCQMVRERSDETPQREFVALQSKIAAEIVFAESETAVPASALDRHKHLIRVVGDALAFLVLPEHTIRTLSRHPGSLPGIAGQGDDFTFVMEVAGSLADSGFCPIISDVTNLIRVGDIVAFRADQIIVLECKNSRLPRRLPGNGRRARQRLRGVRAAQYLQNSRVVEDEGIERVALNFVSPSRRWDAVVGAAERLNSESLSWTYATLGSGDVLALIDATRDVQEIMSSVAQLVDGPAILGMSLNVLKQPRWNCPNPLIYPIDPVMRHELLEGTIIMMRLVEVGRFAASWADSLGRNLELHVQGSSRTNAKWELVVDGVSNTLGPAFLDDVMYNPTSVADMRSALMACAGELTSDAVDESPSMRLEDRNAESSGTRARLAGGDNVEYGTVYLDDTGRIVVVYEAPFDGITPAHIAWDPIAGKTVAIYLDGKMCDAEMAAEALRRSERPS